MIKWTFLSLLLLFSISAFGVEKFTVMECTSKTGAMVVLTNGCKSKVVCYYPNAYCSMVDTRVLKSTYDGNISKALAEPNKSQLYFTGGRSPLVCARQADGSCFSATKCGQQDEKEHNCTAAHLYHQPGQKIEGVESTGAVK